MQPTVTEKKTNVRFSVIDSALKAIPPLGELVLSEMFLHPQRRVPRKPGLGAVIDRLHVGGTEVVVRAQGHGPQVALVHGWRGHMGQFVALRQTLLDAGFTVLTFDMPAHGESKGYTTNIAEFIDVISQVAHNAGRLHGIVAHSLGGTAAALALAKGLPVSSAVLIAPAISFDFALDEFSKTLGLSPESRELTAMAVERRTGVTRGEVDLLRLEAPNIPVRIVHDQQDRRTPVGYSFQLAARWPHAQFATTQGLGHQRILEDEQVLRSIADFLRVVPRQAENVFEATLGAMPSLLL